MCAVTDVQELFSTYPPICMKWQGLRHCLVRRQEGRERERERRGMKWGGREKREREGVKGRERGREGDEVGREREEREGGSERERERQLVIRCSIHAYTEHTELHSRLIYHLTPTIMYFRFC